MKKNGFTLLFAVLVMSLMLAVALSIMSISTKQIIISSIGKESQIAFYAADSGAECVRYWDIHSDVFSTSSSRTTNAITCAGQTIPVNDNGAVMCAADPDHQCQRFSIDGYSLVTNSGPSPQVAIIVEKNYFTNETQIDSRGHNTDVSDAPRKVERAVTLRYTYNKLSFCGFLDVMLVLDTSGSIASSSFAILQNAARNAVTAMKERPDAIVQVGLVNFAGVVGKPTLQAHLDSSEASTTDAIGALPYSYKSNDGTDLTDALAIAGFELRGLQVPNNFLSLATTSSYFSNPPPEDPVHDRKDDFFPDAIILITDGLPNVRINSDGTRQYLSGGGGNDKNPVVLSQVSQQVALLKENGIKTFVIGMPNDLNKTVATNTQNYLKTLASSPDLYFDSSYSTVDSSVKGVNDLLQEITTCN